MMNQKIFEDNMKSLKKRYPRLVEKILEKDTNEDDIKVLSEKAKDEMTILKVQKDNRILYLNGKYAPKVSVDKWLQGLGKLDYQSTLIILGFGNGSYIKKLIESTESSVRILIYEPCISIFLKAMEEIDLRQIFDDRPVGIVFKGINDDEFMGVVKKSVIYDNLKNTKVMVHPNYEELFPEIILSYTKQIQRYMGNLTVTARTNVRFTSGVVKNVLNNVKYIPKNYKIDQLYNVIPTDIPAIVVSAGPSLNKNIKELKRAKNKAFIIATDTSLKPLLKEGIIPDVFVIIDGLKPMSLFNIEESAGIPVVALPNAASEVLKAHKGKKFFYSAGDPYVQEIFIQNNIRFVGLDSGGSVANDAFSLARVLGLKTIILIGQDLAITGNKTHADGTFQEKMEEIDTSSGNYPEVEGIDGTMVVTRNDFRLYLQWFEEQIKKHQSKVHVIDATEGGAKIHGSEIMTLEEAINRECHKEVDISKSIENIQPLFTKEQQKIAEEYINKTPERLLLVRKTAQSGLQHYKRLKFVCEKKKIDEKLYIRLTHKIKKVTEFFEKDPTASLVISSMQSIDLALRENIYDTEDTFAKEGINIAKHGITMCELIIKHVDAIKELSEKILKEDLEG